tara:strand:+ start:623 stop:1282 length:660 start_codon:yes stop_codon:yes gene_type:complete
VLQDQNIKGLTLLEVLVVVVIIGVVSGVGYPKFSKWKKDREVRVASEKIFNLVNTIVAQTQRGYYPYVQVKVDFKKNPTTLTSSGMTKDKFGEELNNGGARLNCSDTVPWNQSPINSYEANKIVFDIEDDGAVCFSKDGKKYLLTGKLDSHINLFIEDRPKGKNDYIIICHERDKYGKKRTSCPAMKNTSTDDPVYLIEWTRFGTVNKFKWDGNAWRRL